MDTVAVAASLCVILALLVAAWSDLAIRTIPDACGIGIALLGLLLRLPAGLSAVAVSLAAATVLFLVTLVLHAKGWLGGGDVKLASAVSVGLSLPALYHFMFITAIAGGVLAAAHLLLRSLVRGVSPPPRRGARLLTRVVAAERWRIARRGSLPYGMAIACGGIWAVLISHGG